MKNKHLTILCSNDAHGNLDNFPGLMGASKKIDTLQRNPAVDTFKISAGDNWAGADVKKNKLVNSLFNYMGFNFTVISNHDFDDGIEALAQKISTTKTKFIATNLDIDSSNPIYGKVGKSYIEEQSGTKYGFVGAVTPDLSNVISQKESMKGLSVQDEKQTFATLQKEVTSLLEQGADRVILASHCGLEFDQKIAQNVSGIDIIASGHSHDLVEGIVPGKNYFTSPSGEPVLIIQSGENAKNHSIVDIEFDDNGKIAKATNTVDTNKPYKNAILEYLKDASIGVSPTIGNISEIQPIAKNRRVEPNGWANLICDAMRSELNVDIAFMNSANVRKIPMVGSLTVRDVKESVPMQNKLLKTTMTEKQIVNALKNGSKSMTAADGYPGIIHTSGLRYKIDTEGNLLELNFVDKEGKVAPIDIEKPSETKTYGVAYDSFMEDGREYPEFMLNGRPAERLDYDKDISVLDYLAKMPKEQKENLKVTNDGRIEIVETSKTLQPSSNTQNFLGLTLPKSA